MSVLELRRVSKVYGEGPAEVHALRDVSLSVDGAALSGMSRNARARLRRRSIGYVFQDFNLLPGLTAVENVTMPLELDGVAAGATIETKTQAPSLAALRNWATTAGILLALGVLAMTVGLIRSETAGELRTLTATGAGGRTRRTLTGATAGALGLLGALLGTAVAYLAAIAWYRSNLATTVSHVPVGDLVVILVGLPLAATIGGWLLAGREPPTIARQPLE